MIIAAVGFVQKAAVVPQRLIALLPAVAVLVLVLDRVRHQFIKQGQGLTVRHANNHFNTNWIDEQRLSTRYRMRLHYWMFDRLGYLFLCLWRQFHQFAFTVFSFDKREFFQDLRGVYSYRPEGLHTPRAY